MELKKVDAGQGWYWIKEGALIFIKNPKVCLLFFIVSLIRWKVLVRMPTFGYLILIFLTPLIVGILFWVCHISLQNGKFESKSFVVSLRSFSAELLRVGFIYSAGLILSAAIMQIITGNSTATMAILGDVKALSRIMSHGRVTSILFASALIPLVASFFLFFSAWFAPALVVFDGHKAKEAMKLSLKAAYRNAAAFTLYGIILGGMWVAYLIAMYLIPGIILISIGFSPFLLPTINTLSVLFWPIISPIILMTVYTSYINVFAVKTDSQSNDRESKPETFSRKVDYQLTFEEYLEAQRAYAKTSRFTYYSAWILGCLGIIVGTIGIIVLPGMKAGYGAVLLGVFLVLSVTILHRYTIARFWKREPNISNPLMVDITEDDLHIISPHEEGRVKWSAFSRFLETKSLFMLFRQRNTFNVIPKRIFRDANEIENFRNMLRRKITGNK